MFFTAKNASGVSQGGNPINGTIVLQIPKEASLDDIIIQNGDVFAIDPQYIAGFVGVDQNGVVSGVVDNLGNDLTTMH